MCIRTMDSETQWSKTLFQLCVEIVARAEPSDEEDRLHRVISVCVILELRKALTLIGFCALLTIPFTESTMQVIDGSKNEATFSLKEFLV